VDKILPDKLLNSSAKEKIYRVFWKTVDFLYPPKCVTCSKPGSVWCSDCQAQAVVIGSNCCPICGYPTLNGQLCEHCRQVHPPFTQARSWAQYEGVVKETLHSLKYKSNLELGIPLAGHLCEVLARTQWTFDLILPMPISKKHLATRGYNQSEVIARPLSYLLQIPLETKAVYRIKETETQVNLNREERFKNLQSAFLGNSAKLVNKKVLLVDDTATTGATLESCAQVLQNAGCCEVYCLTVARTIKYLQ
jgi:ComF family protein